MPDLRKRLTKGTFLELKKTKIVRDDAKRANLGSGSVRRKIGAGNEEAFEIRHFGGLSEVLGELVNSTQRVSSEMSCLDEVFQFLSQVLSLKESVGMDKTTSFVRMPAARLKDEIIVAQPSNSDPSSLNAFRAPVRGTLRFCGSLLRTPSSSVQAPVRTSGRSDPSDVRTLRSSGHPDVRPSGHPDAPASSLHPDICPLAFHLPDVPPAFRTFHPSDLPTSDFRIQIRTSGSGPGSRILPTSLGHLTRQVSTSRRPSSSLLLILPTSPRSPRRIPPSPPLRTYDPDLRTSGTSVRPASRMWPTAVQARARYCGLCIVHPLSPLSPSRVLSSAPDVRPGPPEPPEPPYAPASRMWPTAVQARARYYGLCIVHPLSPLSPSRILSSVLRPPTSEPRTPCPVFRTSDLHLRTPGTSGRPPVVPLLVHRVDQPPSGIRPAPPPRPPHLRSGPVPRPYLRTRAGFSVLRDLRNLRTTSGRLSPRSSSRPTSLPGIPQYSVYFVGTYLLVILSLFSKDPPSAQIVILRILLLPRPLFTEPSQLLPLQLPEHIRSFLGGATDMMSLLRAAGRHSAKPFGCTNKAGTAQEKTLKCSESLVWTTYSCLHCTCTYALPADQDMHESELHELIQTYSARKMASRRLYCSPSATGVAQTTIQSQMESGRIRPRIDSESVQELIQNRFGNRLFGQALGPSSALARSPPPTKFRRRDYGKPIK
ncbi:hypothetical protein K438DRAFT_1767198 [Mycena galopus ATCC 62051]|nr:hypothetical protein K438DRAFT_1767198 [Mycena galopus ATCC 62051]